MKKLEEHDEQLELIAQTVTGHTDRLDSIDETLKDHSETLKDHSGRLDRIEILVTDHTDRLDRIEENMATKEDVSNIMTTLDDLVGYAKKKDQELTMMAHGMKKMRDDIDQLGGWH